MSVKILGVRSSWASRARPLNNTNPGQTAAASLTGRSLEWGAGAPTVPSCATVFPCSRGSDSCPPVLGARDRAAPSPWSPAVSFTLTTSLKGLPAGFSGGADRPFSPVLGERTPWGLSGIGAAVAWAACAGEACVPDGTPGGAVSLLTPLCPQQCAGEENWVDSRTIYVGHREPPPGAEAYIPQRHPDNRIVSSKVSFCLGPCLPEPSGVAGYPLCQKQ